MAGDHVEQQRGVAHRWWRTARSGRASWRTRSARSATRGRRSASRRPRRTARRAGGSSRRCRSRGRAARTRPRPRPPIRRSNRPGTRDGSCGLRVGAERRVLGRRAHRELVEVGLATGTAPGREHAVDDRGGVRRPPALEDLRRARGGHAARAEVVLQRRSARRRADPGRRPAPPRRRRASAASRAASAVTRLHACSSAFARVDDREVLVDDLARRARSRRGPPPPARARSSLAHGASRMRGTRKRPSSAAGRHRQHLVARQARRAPRRRAAR